MKNRTLSAILFLVFFGSICFSVKAWPGDQTNVMITRSKAFLLRAPDNDSEVITELKKNKEYMIAGRSRKVDGKYWYNIHADNQTGWVSARYITVIRSKEGTEQPKVPYRLQPEDGVVERHLTEIKTKEKAEQSELPSRPQPEEIPDGEEKFSKEDIAQMAAVQKDIIKNQLVNMQTEYNTTFRELERDMTAKCVLESKVKLHPEIISQEYLQKTISDHNVSISINELKYKSLQKQIGYLEKQLKEIETTIKMLSDSLTEMPANNIVDINRHAPQR